MDNKRKFTSIFSSTIGLVVTILVFSVMGLKLISGVLSMILSYNVGVFSLVIQILKVCFLSLVAIGFLCCYVNGKKDEISPSGLMCLRVFAMISGISTFVIYIIAGIAILLTMIVGGGVASYLDGGFAIAIIAVLCLAFIYFILMGVINLMYGIKTNGFLAAVRWKERRDGIANVGFLRFFAILNIIFTSFSLISNIVNMILPLILEDIVDEFGEVGKIIFNILGISSDGLIINIISIVIILVDIAIYVCIFILYGKVKNEIIMNNSSVEEDNEPEFIPSDNSADKYDEVGTDVLDINKEIPYQEEPKVEGVSIADNPIVDVPEKKGHITVISGKDKGVSYPVSDGEEIIIGKDPKCAHIIVSNEYQKVSRIHCGIKYDAANDKYIVIDYSTNGTYINSITKGRLTKGVYTPLPKGTIINLSKEALDYKLD